MNGPSGQSSSGEPPNHRKRAGWFLLFAAAISLCLIIPTWRASWGRLDFHSDEAIFGLMARHILQGEFPTFFYGQNYMGSAEAVVAAGLMYLFGNDIFALRLAAVLEFGVFFVLHAALVSRLWGCRVALISLLPMIVPAMDIVRTIYIPVGYAPLLVLGTGALLLGQIPAPNRLRYVRSGLLGILIGLGLWSNQLMIIYFVALAVVYWLSTPEWSAIYSRLNVLCERAVQIPARILLLVLMFGAAVLATLAFFSGACMPEALFAYARSMARGLLVVGIAGLALLTFGISKRRWRLSAEGGAMALGVILGGLPQWRSWLQPDEVTYGVPYGLQLLPSCPTGLPARARLVIVDVLPALWGIPHFDLPERPLLEVIVGISWAIVLLFVVALGSYVWKERTTLWSLLAFMPLTQSRQGAAMVCLLLCLPLTLVVLSANTVDFTAGIRYSIVAWQASSILLAIFLARFRGRFKVVGLILIAFFVLQMGVTILIVAPKELSERYGPYAPEEVTALEDYLTQNDLRLGYADYWDSYTLDFVTEERLVIAPYNGADRYPRYSEIVAASPVQVFVFKDDNRPRDTGRMEDLLVFLRQAQERSPDGRPAFPHIEERLESQVVLQQDRVESWAVWVVADR